MDVDKRNKLLWGCLGCGALLLIGAAIAAIIIYIAILPAVIAPV